MCYRRRARRPFPPGNTRIYKGPVLEVRLSPGRVGCLRGACSGELAPGVTRKLHAAVPRCRVRRSGRRDVEANDAPALKDVCHRNALVTSPVHVVWEVTQVVARRLHTRSMERKIYRLPILGVTRSRRRGSEPIRCSSLVISERGLLPVRTQLPTETSAHSRDIGGARAEKKSGVPLMPSAKKVHCHEC